MLVQQARHLGPFPMLALADTETEDNAPLRKWVLIAPLGTQVVPGYDTPYTLDAAGARRIVEVWQHYADHGHRAIFDWGHGSVFPSTPEMHGKSGEIHGMEFREAEGVYADVEFTSRASSLIRSGDFDQVSPELRSTWRNLDTGETEEGPAVHAVALTARGQLGGMPALTASWQALATKFGLSDASALLDHARHCVGDAAKAGKFGAASAAVCSCSCACCATGCCCCPCTSPACGCSCCLGRAGDAYCCMPGGGACCCCAEVKCVEIDPEWSTVMVHNHKTGVHYMADLVDVGGSMTLGNVREGTMEFKPKGSMTPPAGGQEDMVMADAAQAKALSDAQAENARLLAENTTLKALAEAAKAAGAETPEAIQALAQRPAQDRFAALEATVTTLGQNLASRDEEIKALSAANAAYVQERKEKAANDLVRVYEDKGKVTHATRDHYRKIALADPDGFKALAEVMPVHANYAPRGTAGDDDRSEQPETLHGVAMALAETMTPGNPMASYGKAVEQTAKDREDLVGAWRNGVPNVVSIRR